MKRILVAGVLSALFFMPCQGIYAQGEKKMPGQEMKMKMVEDITKTMVKQYGLNSEQADALRQLNLKRMKDIAAIDAAMDIRKANAAQKAEIKKMKAEVQSQYDSIIKDLFSEKQYEKYMADEAEKKERIKGNVNWMANIATRMLGEKNINLLGWNSNVADSLKIAQEATNRMARKYKLDKEQQEKLLALNIAEVSAEIAERRNITLDDVSEMERAEKAKEFAKQARTRSANYERYLKGILTEDQYKKYSNSKKAQQSREQRFGGFGFGGPPPRW